MNPDQERVRDHLANERTFLAWLRTAMGIVVFGFAIARFSLAIRQLAGAQGKDIPASGISLWLGNLAIIFGISVIFAALARFHRTKRQLETGTFSTHYGLIWFVAGLSALFALALMLYLVAARTS